MATSFLSDEQKISKILLDQNYIGLSDFKKAQQFAQKNKSSIISYLIANELISKDILGQAVAEYYKISYADLNSNPPSREQVLKIPENIAKKYRLVFFKSGKSGLVIATDNPEQKNKASQLKKLFGNKKIIFAYSLSEDIDKAFVYYRKKLQTRFSQIIKKENSLAPEIIDEIISDALVFRASDIHFDPENKEVVIRFRVDGMLTEAGRIDKKYYENILNRIKVQAHLRLDEHFTTQDGAIRHTLKDSGSVDMRVSIVPTLNGEKIVIRILSEYVKDFTLNDIGLSETNQKLLKQVAALPFGMILVSGPTGSGKTTTLYSLLKTVNKPEANVTTIEDPVEYRVRNVNQIQVNPQTNLTFSKGLRSIVRQDPDIILVGEIRDNETAEIAVNAALTGHLLLSTFHANDAATSIPRLLDMEVEPFLLASTLELIIAQRLVRKICSNCRVSFSKKIIELEKELPGAKRFFKGNTTTLYKGKGCEECSNSGYSGRTAIFEFIRVTPEMEELILQNPSTQQIWQLAKKQGALSLFEDGLDKVKNGTTTLEELTRVAPPLS